MKLPETLLVFVIERAARRKTFDFVKALFLSLGVASTVDELLQPLLPTTKLIELGFILKALLRSSVLQGTATVS